MINTGQKQNTNTLLHMLLSAEDPSTGKAAFTDDELMSHVTIASLNWSVILCVAHDLCCMQTLTFMVAGHETSSNGLCWLFYLLAQNPRVEAKLKGRVVCITCELSPCEWAKCLLCKCRGVAATTQWSCSNLGGNGTCNARVQLIVSASQSFVRLGIDDSLLIRAR